MKEDIRILYVDDEVNNLSSFKTIFRRDYTVFTAISAEDGRKVLETEDVHVVITDQRMPNTSGIEFLESILDVYPDPIRILLTGYADIQAVIDAINKGQVYRYLTKPWNEQELRLVIKDAHELYSLRKENKELMQSLIKANKQLEFLLRQKLIS